MNGSITTPQTLKEQILGHYRKNLLLPKSPGMAFLEGFGIFCPETISQFQIGYGNGDLPEFFSATPEQKQVLKDLGFLNLNSMEHFVRCIVSPAYNSMGEIVEVYGLKTTDRRLVKMLGFGSEGIVNPQAFIATEEIILCENPQLAWFLHQAGKKNVTALIGKAVNDDLLQEIKNRNIKTVYVLARLSGGLILSALKSLNLNVLRVPVPQANKEITAETIDSYFAQAESIQSLRQISHSEMELDPKSGTQAFKLEGIEYLLRGLNLNTAIHMKATITAKNELGQYVDRFDLYNASARAKFAFASGQKLNEEHSKIDHHLISMIEEIEKVREAVIGKGLHRVFSQKPLTETEKKEAHSFLQSPDLLEKIESAYETLGYVGESLNKRLAFLIGLSRKLKQPMSGRIASPSGLGKSLLMECTGQMTPPEDLIFLSRLSAKALYHLEQNALAHKLVIVDERQGSEDADYPIRSLLTANQLSLAFTSHDPATGQVKTKFHTVSGPISYMESTTRGRVNPENASRSFELRLSQNPEQTKRILEAQKQRRENPVSLEKLEALKTLLHNAQRLLKDYGVLIPFARHIEFPTLQAQFRRNHDRFLILIEANAFLHQYQREQIQKNGETFIIANLEDYKLAHEIAQDVLFREGQELSQGAFDLYGQILSFVKDACNQHGYEAHEFKFRRKEIREYTQTPNHLIKRYMRELEDLEYLEVQRRKSGSMFDYQIFDLKPLARKRIPLLSPEDLAEKLNGKDKSPKADQSGSKAEHLEAIGVNS